MIQTQQQLEVATAGRGLLELTAELAGLVQRSGVRTGQLTVFCRHTSASLLVHENADPSASTDLLAWLERMAPDGDPSHTHTAEGPDDMPAHLRSVLTTSSLTIPVVDGRLALGTWQGVFLAEHRRRPHRRRLVLHVVGE